MPILFGPLRKLTDQLDVSVSRLGYALKIFFETAAIVQRPHHHRKLRPVLLSYRLRLSHQLARADRSRSNNRGHLLTEVPSTQHAGHPNKTNPPSSAPAPRLQNHRNRSRTSGRTRYRKNNERK